MLDPMLGKQERELTQPEGTCFGGGMWFGWRPKTWAAPKPSSIKELPLCSLAYMAAFSLKCIFLLFCPLYLLQGKTCTQGRLETQPLWVEGAGAVTGMAAQGRGLQLSLSEGFGQ